jgi:DNA repair photolyase
MRAEYRLEPCRTALNRVKGMSFRWSLNPYMGCAHQCTFCFVRAFERLADRPSDDRYGTSIRVKTNIVEQLRRELGRRSWKREQVVIGTATDPYQPAEGRYRLTRGIVEALAEARNPFSILTKSTLIGRDADLLAEALSHPQVQTALSIGCLDAEVWRATEPHTPSPRKRMETVARLNAAGVPCEVMIAPVLPGISDADGQLEEVVRAAVDAGATVIAPIALHLRGPLRDHYLGWLAEARPELLAGTRRRYRGAYAPAPERDALSARVRELVAKHGGGRRDRSGWSWRAPDPAPEPDDRAEQLSLL